jgi:hypothetical protein
VAAITPPNSVATITPTAARDLMSGTYPRAASAGVRDDGDAWVEVVESSGAAQAGRPAVRPLACRPVADPRWPGAAVALQLELAFPRPGAAVQPVQHVEARVSALRPLQQPPEEGGRLLVGIERQQGRQVNAASRTYENR